MLGITLQENLPFPSHSRQLSQAMIIPQSATNRAAQDNSGGKGLWRSPGPTALLKAAPNSKLILVIKAVT